MKRIAIGLVAAGLLAGPAAAATVHPGVWGGVVLDDQTQAEVGNQSYHDHYSGQVSSVCSGDDVPTGLAPDGSMSFSTVCEKDGARGSLDTYSDAGRMGTTLSASYDGGPAPAAAAAPYSAGVFGGSSILDELAIDGPESGYLDLTFRLEGSTSLDLEGAPAAGSSDVFWVYFYVENQDYYPSGFDGVILSEYFSEARVYDTLLTARIAYRDNAALLYADTAFQALCPFAAEGATLSCIAGADFGSTLTFAGAEVLDGALQRVEGAKVTGAGGFDYVAGYQAVPAAVVPLPAAGLLLLTAVAGLAVRARV